MSFRDWVRGFFVDPKLEKKAHKFVDKAEEAAKKASKVADDAERLVGEARRTLRQLNPMGAFLVSLLVIVGLGAVAGVLAEKLRKEMEDKKEKEENGKKEE
jgi:hypothetical protein